LKIEEFNSKWMQKGKELKLSFKWRKRELKSSSFSESNRLRKSRELPKKWNKRGSSN
jgi:hypothetical protein